MVKASRKRMIPILTILVSMLMIEPFSFHALIQENELQDVILNQVKHWDMLMDSLEHDWLIFARTEKIDRAFEKYEDFLYTRHGAVIFKTILCLNMVIEIYIVSFYQYKNKDRSDGIPLGGHAPPNLV